MLDKSNPNKGLTDMVGTTIVTKSFDDINYLKDKIQAGQLGKVVDFDDYYSHPKNGYMAYHFIILDKNTDIPFEVQLKTERMKKLNRASHNAYKYENLDGSKLLRYTRMAQKADEGNLKAQKSFDILTKDMEDLEMSLFKDKTKIKKHD
jgi:ppGpp synthetase/RelA/SpoT-type nucleotidyltranferase